MELSQGFSCFLSSIRYRILTSQETPLLSLAKVHCLSNYFQDGESKQRKIKQRILEV